MTSHVGHLEIGIDHLDCARFKGYLPVRQWLPDRGRSCRKCAVDGATATIHAEGPQRALDETLFDSAKCNTAIGGLVDATPRERATEHAGVALTALRPLRSRRTSMGVPDGNPGGGNCDIRYAGAVPSLTTRIAATLAAWSAPLFLTSCHSAPSSDHAHTLPGDDKPVITGEPAPYNSADVAFANSVTAQEQQGIDISRLVPDQSTNSKLVTFAAKTAAALQVDTEVLKALAAQWKEGQDQQPEAGGTTSTTGGILDNAAIAKLDSSHGSAFDTLWLKSMIGLDQGAIEAANAEIANGKNVDATSLAKQIVKARQAEIGQMQQMLAS